MPKSDSKAAEFVQRDSTHWEKEIGGERDSWRDRKMSERVIYDFNPIYKAAEFAMYVTMQ
jgi:hypothetical protein